MSSLLFYCNTLPLSFLIDERRLIFLNKMLNSDIQLLKLLAKFGHYEYLATAGKYNVTLLMCKNNIRGHIWQTFVDSIEP